MRHAEAVKFNAWWRKYPWIVDYSQKISLDIDHKICQYSPKKWTYMFKTQDDRDNFKCQMKIR
jgi:hypothetical protein